MRQYPPGSVSDSSTITRALGAPLAVPVGEAEARYAGADHDDLRRLDLRRFSGQRGPLTCLAHRRGPAAAASAAATRAISFSKMRRAMALAQPYVLSMPKYDRLFESKLWRREYGVSEA